MKIQKEQITVQSFVEVITRVGADTETAAKILVALIDRDGPSVYKKITDALPNLPLNMLANLEKAGRGVIPFAMLWDSSPASYRIRQLPPALQKKAYAEPIEVVQFENGKKVVRKKEVTRLTPAEVKLVFAGGKWNDASEQAKLIDADSVQPKPHKNGERYRILDDGSVEIESRTRLTAAQVEELAKRCKEKSIQSLKR